MSAIKSESSTKVDLDNILIEEVGQFGKYQLITFLLAALPTIFSSWATFEYIFTTARIRHRCLIPECDGLDPEFAPSWILNAIPGTSASSFESCERYGNNTNSLILPTPDFCPADIFDRNHRQACNEFMYEDRLSVVYDFNLGCEEWRRTQIGSICKIGTLFAMPLTGYISDRWGRRVALSINAFNTAWVGIVRSFVNSYEWFTALEAIEAAIGAGAYTSCYILVTELVGLKFRVAAGATINTIFAIGQIIMGFIAWVVPSWRHLTRVLYGPQILVVSYFWILSESVRWLMSKGRYEESEKILKKVAKRNKKQLSEKSLEALRATVEAEKNTPKSKEDWLVILVFRSRIILSRCLVTPIWWITNMLIYYGMSINSINMIGNKYLNYIAVAAIEIPGYWTAILLLDRIGRKPVLICAYWLCAAFQFMFVFLGTDNSGLRLGLYLFGKYCIAIVVTSVYVYTAELYPTKYRHNLFAFSSMIGRLGSITAPLTPAFAQELWEPFPFVLFGSFAVLSGALVFTTPETLGLNLPETFEDAERIGTKKTSSKSQLFISFS